MKSFEVLQRAREALQALNEMYEPPFYFKEEVKRILEEDLGSGGFSLVFMNQNNQLLDPEEARKLVKNSDSPMISSVYTIGTIDQRVSVFLLRLRIAGGKLDDVKNAKPEQLLAHGYLESYRE